MTFPFSRAEADFVSLAQVVDGLAAAADGCAVEFVGAVFRRVDEGGGAARENAFSLKRISTRNVMTIKSKGWLRRSR
jgi:hypothetical protein